MLSDKPAVKIVIPFILGIIAGQEIIIPIYPTITLSVLILLFVIIFYKFKYNLLVNFLLILLFFSIGFLKIQSDAHYFEINRIDKFIDHPDYEFITGAVCDLPSRNPRYLQFVIEADTIYTKNNCFETYGGVLVAIPSEDLDNFQKIRYGDRVRLYSKLLTITSARNPGDFDMKNYLNANNIFTKCYLEYPDEIQIVNKSKSFSFLKIIFSIRSSIAERLGEFVGGVEASFLKGILIGDRSEIPFDLKESFINSGVIHILAVSGLHVGMLILILVAILDFIRMNEKMKFFTISFILIFYIFLTGAAPSVIRASIMAIVLLGGTILERRLNIYNSLAVAALIILLYDARFLFHSGFQLSFIAVISIVALYPQIMKINEVLPKSLKSCLLLQKLLMLFAISISAAIGTLPFTSYYFGKISIIGIVANLVIIPLMTLVLALGLTVTIFSFLNDFVTSFFAESTKFFTYILLVLVDYFGNLKFSHINEKFSFEAGVLYYIVILFLFSATREIFLKRILIAVFLVTNLTLYIDLFRSEKLKIIFFDVGQGDAALIRTPDGENILIDAGAKTAYRDVAERFIVPYLKRNNINKLDLMINSHPHSDHIGGMPYILRSMKVNRVVDAGSAESTIFYLEYKKLIDSLQISYKQVGRGDTVYISKKIRMYILHPDILARTERNLNNHSLVIKVLFGKNSILLTGDVEEYYENDIINHYKEFVKSDILKAAHHGSNSSNSDYFLSYVKPSIAVISVGFNNKFNHPSPQVLERFLRNKINYMRTDLDGAGVFELTGENVRKIDWRN